MPIYMQFESIRGDVVTTTGVANGGDWQANYGSGGAVRLSRISLVNGVVGVDGREALPMRKAVELFDTARRQGPNGKLIVGTDTGVFSTIDPLGRLLVGTDSGVWSGVVQILVIDAGRTSGRIFLLRNVTISKGPGEMLTLDFSKVEF